MLAVLATATALGPSGLRLSPAPRHSPSGREFIPRFTDACN